MTKLISKPGPVLQIILILLFLSININAQQNLTPEQKAKAESLLLSNPGLFKKIKDNPALVEKLKNNPELVKKLEDNPELVRQIETNPDMLDEILSGAPEKKVSAKKMVEAKTVDEIKFEPESTSDDKDSSALDSLSKIKESEVKPADDNIGNLGKIYGRSLFKDGFQAMSSKDIPEDYKLVEGDQVLLRLWGRYNLEKIYTIGEDGYVFIDPLNKQTYLKGMTHRAVKQMIRKVIEDMAGVEGDMKVISTHPIAINISGSAKKPGTVLIPPYFTFWQALMISGGPSDWGSIRNIRLIRDNKTIHKLDIYDYLKTGKLPEPGLRENDLILFGDLENVVEISGIVRKSGFYELKNSENLGDLIEHAGGFISAEFSPVVYIERVISVQERTAQGPTRKVLDLEISGEKWKSTKLKDGDRIFEQKKETLFSNFVSISGQGINVPGKYALSEPNNTLWDVIQKAGGLIEGHSKNLEIIRIYKRKDSKSIQLNIEDESVMKSTRLVSGDSILTYHMSQFKDETMIKVQGFVRDSISILYSDSLTLLNVIQRAGGVRDGGLSYVYVKKTDENDNINYEKVLLSEAALYSMDKRDEVYAFGYGDFNKQFPVVVLAENKEPLTLKYTDDLTLNIIIHRLGGLHISTDSGKIEINTPDFSSENVFIRQRTIALDAKTLDEASLIQPGTLIIFRNDAKKEPPEFVHLIGEFVRPGSYAIRSKQETIETLFKMAGGVTERANPYSLYIERMEMDGRIPIPVSSTNPVRFKGNWLLRDGDKIYISRNDNTVEVSGSVFNPGVVSYNESYSWKDYMNKGAGGALDTADVDKAYIVYPNGNTMKARKGWWRSSKVVPDAKVIIPMKPYIEPQEGKEFDSKEFFVGVSTTLTAITSLITVIILSKNL